MRKSIFLVAAIFIFTTGLVSAEEITLTTIIPNQSSQTTIRGKHAAIGNTYSNTSEIPDDITYFKDDPDIDVLIEGNVGIGTKSPLASLSIYTDAVTKFYRADFHGPIIDMKPTPVNNGVSIIRMFTNAITNVQYSINAGSGTVGGENSNFRICDESGGPGLFRDRFVITPAGKIGIDTDTPAGKVHIVDTSAPSLIAESSATVGTWIRLLNTSVGGANWNIISTGSANGEGPGKLLFYNTSSGGTRMIIDTAGNVGIGTTSPSGKLDVNGTIYQRGSLLHADYVFEPGYKLESIENHAGYMWQNKHLQAVPVAKRDENNQEMIEIGANTKGILEELEKAHVYIQQLNERIKVLEARMKKQES